MKPWPDVSFITESGVSQTIDNIHYHINNRYGILTCIASYSHHGVVELSARVVGKAHETADDVYSEARQNLLDTARRARDSLDCFIRENICYKKRPGLERSA